MDWVNFIVYTYDIKNKQIYIIYGWKKAKFYQLSTSFQVKFEVYLQEFWKEFFTLLWMHIERAQEVLSL